MILNLGVVQIKFYCTSSGLLLTIGSPNFHVTLTLFGKRTKYSTTNPVTVYLYFFGRVLWCSTKKFEPTENLQTKLWHRLRQDDNQSLSSQIMYVLSLIFQSSWPRNIYSLQNGEGRMKCLVLQSVHWKKTSSPLTKNAERGFVAVNGL